MDHLMGAAKPIIEILGQPKTVRMVGRFGGRIYEGNLETWVTCVVMAMSPEQQAKFFPLLENMQQKVDAQRGGNGAARVVAEIAMPNLKP